MKFTTEELIKLLISLDAMINSDYDDIIEIKKEKLCIKISKEIYKRGFKNIVSDRWLKIEESKNVTAPIQ